MPPTNTNTVTFPVKLAYMIPMEDFTFPTHYTISQMIHKIKATAHDVFELDRHAFPEVEVVEAGQPNNINGQHAEVAPALEPSNITIEEKYGTRYNSTGFYLRLVPRHVVLERRGVDKLYTDSPTTTSVWKGYKWTGEYGCFCNGGFVPPDMYCNAGFLHPPGGICPGWEKEV